MVEHANRYFSSGGADGYMYKMTRHLVAPEKPPTRAIAPTWWASMCHTETMIGQTIVMGRRPLLVLMADSRQLDHRDYTVGFDPKGTFVFDVTKTETND
jgi:hypothetical protein